MTQIQQNSAEAPAECKVVDRATYCKFVNKHIALKDNVIEAKSFSVIQWLDEANVVQAQAMYANSGGDKVIVTYYVRDKK